MKSQAPSSKNQEPNEFQSSSTNDSNKSQYEPRKVEIASLFGSLNFWIWVSFGVWFLVLEIWDFHF
jgi:hypothetical protein